MDIPNSWEECRFDSVARVVSGKHQRDVEEVDGIYPIYGSGGIFGRASDFICEPGTTVIGRKGTINTPIFVNERFWNVDTAFGLCPIDAERLLPRFLFYFCESFNFYSLDKSTTIPSLAKRDIEAISIPLPPLNEQKRIVAKVEELFTELDAGEKSLRQARKQLGLYRQSLLKQAFEGKLTATWREQHPELIEWSEVLLSSVVAFTNGFAFKSKEYSEDGIPVVRISDISEAGVCLDSAVKIPPRPEFEKFCLQQGDILIAMSGATTGKFGELKSDKKCYQNQRVGCFRTLNEDDFSQRFLHNLLYNLKRQIENDAYGGAQPNISGKQINAYLIPKPSLPEQQEIVRILDEQFEVIEQNEREIDAALKRSEALRQSILKKAFSGQLVPQDPDDEPASVLLERIRAERETAPNVTPAKRGRKQKKS